VRYPFSLVIVASPLLLTVGFDCSRKSNGAFPNKGEKLVAKCNIAVAIRAFGWYDIR